jgi:cytochrome c556
MFVATRELLLTMATGATLAGMVASAALAGPIEDRQKSMKEQGALLKPLVAMLKGESPFDAAEVKASADGLVTHFEHDKTLFPDGSDKGDVETWAKPEIWSDKEAFLSRFDDGIAASRELGTVADIEGLGVAMGKMGKGVCGACHEKYRRPKG